MKKLLSFFLFLFTVALSGQETYVPDDNFEQRLIDLGYDNVLDDYVLTQNIANITDLDISNSGIVNLEGLQDFISLLNLEAAGNPYENQLICNPTVENIDIAGLNLATELDFSCLPSLIRLYADNSENLVSIDISSNIHLIGIFCQNCPALTSIDVSNNPNLEVLLINQTINQGNIYDLDVSNNTLLTALSCSACPIDEIDLSNNPLLEDVQLNFTNMTSINFSNNPNLYSVLVNNNEQLMNLNMANGGNSELGGFITGENCPVLSCVQIDEGFTPDPGIWLFDPGVEFSTNCFLGSSDNQTNYIQLFPVPVDNILSFRGSAGKLKIRVYDISGRLIIEETIIDKLNVSSLKTGTYSILIENDNHRETHKFIKN